MVRCPDREAMALCCTGLAAWIHTMGEQAPSTLQREQSYSRCQAGLLTQTILMEAFSTLTRQN